MTKYVKIDGKKIEINIFGKSKNILILVPGWTHDFKNEIDFVKMLSKNYQVVTLSYPGYSNSEENPKSQSILYLSYIANEVIKQLKFKRFIFVGFSMGCQVVLSYLENFDKKQKCILISPTFEPLNKYAPLYAKLILSSNLLVKLFRNSKFIEKVLINKAYKSIHLVTEGKGKNISFNSKTVSLNGAYDTLIATTTSFIDPLKYRSNIKFIAGDKETLQNKLKVNEYTVIKDCGHGDFKRRSIEFVQEIDKLAIF